MDLGRALVSAEIDARARKKRYFDYLLSWLKGKKVNCYLVRSLLSPVNMKLSING